MSSWYTEATRRLALALPLLGCADEATIPDDDVGLPEHDAALRCIDASAPELMAIGGVSPWPITVGPCGHVAYHDDQGQGWLIEPDGIARRSITSSIGSGSRRPATWWHGRSISTAG